MNALTAQLSYDFGLAPMLFKGMRVQVVSDPDITQYERDTCKTLIARHTGLKIARIYPKYQLGGVISFDVTPEVTDDPTLAFAWGVNLVPYYQFWAKAITKSWPWGMKYETKRAALDFIIQGLVNDSEHLSPQERLFLVIEVMKMDNEILL
jgi:hypothetical protein